MKLVVTIEPGWFYEVRTVELKLDPEGYADYTGDEIDRDMAELAEDIFNDEVSYGWEVVYD
jgi:hypothetical protein